MRVMTEKFLTEAFAGESMAHMRYQHFADKAEMEGFPEMARMFRAISFAERVHAGNHYRALGQIQETAKNIQICIDGENYEINDMYPVFNATAKLQNEPQAEQSTHYALEAEKIHSAWYTQAKASIEDGQDVKVATIQICSVCGHTREGEAPDRCPICGAPKTAFREF
jgi:rubrerythrin